MGRIFAFRREGFLLIKVGNKSVLSTPQNASFKP